MAEHQTPSPEENVSVFKLPCLRKTIATLSVAAATGNLVACAADDKECEVVGTHVMQLGETVWGAVDSEIPTADKKESYDKRERMDWIKEVNPGMKTIGDVQIGDTVNIPGNCK